MISTTTTGIIYPHIGAAQAIGYVNKPNAYMSQLKDATLQQQHTAAMNNHMEQDMEKGRQFVAKAAHAIDWDDLPSGQHIDEWA